MILETYNLLSQRGLNLFYDIQASKLAVVFAVKILGNVDES